MSFENSCHYPGGDHISRPQRSEDFRMIPPGPMAQAFTFRALGAESRCFHSDSVASGIRTQAGNLYLLGVWTKTSYAWLSLCPARYLATARGSVITAWIFWAKRSALDRQMDYSLSTAPAVFPGRRACRCRNRCALRGRCFRISAYWRRWLGDRYPCKARWPRRPSRSNASRALPGR